MLKEKNEKSGLTEEEVQILEDMRNSLMGDYQVAVSCKYNGSWEAQTSTHTAALGYAVITDILNRNRNIPKP